jgi:hypothetical protein
MTNTHTNTHTHDTHKHTRKTHTHIHIRHIYTHANTGEAGPTLKGAYFYRIIDRFIDQTGVEGPVALGAPFRDDMGGLSLKHDRKVRMLQLVLQVFVVWDWMVSRCPLSGIAWCWAGVNQGAIEISSQAFCLGFEWWRAEAKKCAVEIRSRLHVPMWEASSIQTSTCSSYGHMFILWTHVHPMGTC